MSEIFWFRDRLAWRLIARGYVPWLAALNLVWEATHVRLYTLWEEAGLAYVAFSVVHCTLGDVLIGGLALLLSLTVLRERGVAHWRWGRVAALAILVGVAYTVFSEWMNITILRSWAYSERMPTLGLGGMEIGVSPLLQWLLLPALSLHLARTIGRRPASQDRDQESDDQYPAQQAKTHHPPHH